MAIREYPHILVNRPAQSEPYTSHAKGGSSTSLTRELSRSKHGTNLIDSTRNAQTIGLQQRQESARRIGTRLRSNGVYLTFDSWPNHDLHLSVFDPQTRGVQPDLRSVQYDGTVQRATVFVPEGKIDYFIGRFKQYLTADTDKGRPRNERFVERISDISPAIIQYLWTDNRYLFPENEKPTWWEVWLRNYSGKEFGHFQDFCKLSRIDSPSRKLTLDNRTVILVHATASDLADAMDVLDDLAEIRSADTAAADFEGIEISHQHERVTELRSRISYPRGEQPRICILDTGVNNHHPLLMDSLQDTDLHTFDPSWLTSDHDGHGTKMAGLALFGDLHSALTSQLPIDLLHDLESVKILSPRRMVTPDLYGAITGYAVDAVETHAIRRNRHLLMSMNSTAQRMDCSPTLWSVALDALAVGRRFDYNAEAVEDLDEECDNRHRLFLVSAGNIEDPKPDEDPLARSDKELIRDPAQAWNVLTVGAYTELTDVAASGPSYQGWSPLTPAGDLSAFSRTSVNSSKTCPIKPDVVLEGGNVAVSPNRRQVDWPDSIALLTTSRDIPARMLTTTNATSAATAQAACLAAKVSAAYPTLWPETVRALIVHSAEWTAVMLRHFNNAGGSRSNREKILRRYGFGVPNEERVLKSAANALTLIVQDRIRPFTRRQFDEMHTHQLPWPISILEKLADAPVRLHVTLSYFIEPNAAKRGSSSRFRYASHALRFHLKRPHENLVTFRKRLNKQALDHNEPRVTAGGDPGWFLGANTRQRGSLHGDYWDGTAQDLAKRGCIAVVPTSGWWKDSQKRDKSHLGVRYGLIVSISTPDETVDLWTPVANEVRTLTEVVTERP